MFLPVSSIPEQYLYRLLPQGVIDLDQRNLIEAVLGGYQDRISDLRSYVNGLSELVKPDADLPQLGFNVILVRFAGPSGQIVTRSLDILPTAPNLDDADALKAWAAGQLQLDVSEILSAIAGTDILRKIDVDSISLLAENVGALLYPGLNDETIEEQRQTRQRLLQSWFPRLKIKGTAASYEVFGRVIGFEDVAVTPLWSRLVPHLPNDPGNSVNNDDFSSKPEQTPAASLPDVRYDPIDFADGIFYDWASGPLSENPDDANYWPLAVNNRNPFVKITTLGPVKRPKVGRYTLDGGGPNLKAGVSLDSGTLVSNLLLNAVADGETFNGMRVNVIDFGGTAAGLSISDKMTAIKYRSSYFDFKATILSIGTETVQPSPDLEKFAALTSDGTAQAPFRPWTGGSIASSTVLFPDVSSSYGAVVHVRTQAAGTATQLVSSQFDSAERAIESFESLRSATRRIRAKGVGLAMQDAATLAAYANETTLFTAAVGSISGVGTYEGSVIDAEAPAPPYAVFLQAYIGTQARDTFMDSTSAGTVSIAGDGFLGIYRLTDNYYRMLVSAGQFGAGGMMKAFFTAQLGTNVRTEPTYDVKAIGTVGFLSRPEDQIDESDVKTSIYDENPWRRDLVLGGESVDIDLYLPKDPDLSLKSAEPPYQALALSGHQYEIAVLDGTRTFVPYRFKVLETPEADPITGQAVQGPYDRLLLALDQNNLLYHVLLIDNVLVSTQYWCPAKWNGIAQWTPFNEHPLDSIKPYSRYAQAVDSDIRHYYRQWDSAKGWYTKFAAGDGVSLSADLSLGDSYTLAFWLRPELASGSGDATRFLTLGNSTVLSLTPGGSCVVSLTCLVNGVTTSAGSANLLINQWWMLAIRVSGTTVSLGYGSSSASITWVNSTLSVDPINTQNIRVESLARSFGIHDLTLWDIAKTDADLDTLRDPDFAPSVVPYPTPYIESLSRDSRYVMRLVSSGFSYPDTEEVVQHAYNPAYAQRYDFDALYQGDPRFKQTGLGDGNGSQPSYPLGLRGIYVDGFGRTLVSGSNPSLPGITNVWGTTPGTSIEVVPPYTTLGGTNQNQALPSSPWPNLELTNPAQDRVYLKGDDNLVYKVIVDDVGSGPVLVAQRVQRARPSLEGTVTPTFRDQPTDASTTIGSPGKRLSVSASGTNFTVYEKVDGSQTATTPPVYLYRQSRVVVSALSTSIAYARWANPTALGQSIGVPALENNGAIDFANIESITNGIYQLTFDVSNVGTVDDDFDGFSTTISIIGSGGSVLASIPVTLLQGGTGADPRGLTSVNITLPTSINTSWILGIDWNNDRDVPRKGQKRQLAVHGYEIRLVAPALYRLSNNPLALSLVDVNDTANVRAGGLYAEINSFGTAVAIRHEAAVYPGTSDWPLSNLATTSTWMRRESLRVRNPVVAPDPTVLPAPIVTGVAPNPNSLYNLGDVAALQAQVIGAGTVASYVWRFWDNTVETTAASTVAKVVTPGVGTNYNGSFTVSAVDYFGNQSTASSVVLINRPPDLQVNSTRSVGIFPYIAEISGTVSDPDGQSVSLAWYENGSLIATGSPHLYTAQQSTFVIGRATDSAGGITERRLAFDGSPHQKPVVSPIIRPDSGRISNINEVSFAVYALDPNTGGPLTFSWQHWNGTSSGTTTNVSNSNSKFNQITIGLAGQQPGDKTVTVTVTDQDGYSMIVQTTIELIANVPPIISSVTTPSPGALAGSLVPFAAVAVDADGDPPGYTWNFTSPRAVTLYGGNILFPSISADNGSVINGTLIVDDSNGGSVSAPIPPVFLANTSIPPLTVSSVPGFYQAGFNQQLTSTESDVVIRYSVDGTDIFKITDGLPYTGAFAFLPPTGGKGTKTLKARAFKVGFAPSDQFSGEYQFYDPNAVASSTPEVGAGTSKLNLTLVTLQSTSDSVITTAAGASIPGDTQKVDANPASTIPGLSAQALANEPVLPFTPTPLGGVATETSATPHYVTLQTPI